MWNRRAFLKAGALALMSFGWGGTPLFLTRAANAAERGSRRKVLVAIFQRGAMDGLMAVQPLGDPVLARLRPGLLLPRQGAGALVPLDDRFGLHPALAPLGPLYREGALAVLHGVGSPNSTRSHFDAQDYMESGTPGRKGTSSGWLNRAAGMLGHEATPFQAVALTEALPKSLYGSHPALAVSSLEDFHLAARAEKTDKSLEALYQQASQKALQRRGGEAFAAMDLLSEKRYVDYRPAPGVVYPNSPLGRSLRQIAFLVKADVGLEIAFAESNGWDTHRGQGAARGVFAQRATDLAQALSAFWADLGGSRSDVVLMTMTEFGRTVAQNGSGGTDHGRGSCMFVLGESVRGGGQVRGQVAELRPEALEDGRDLPVTTDFRAVFAGVAAQHLGIRNSAALFPGWRGQDVRLLG
jgi:uncharacterized protein (DUF1501 family)